jgi:acyl-CoA thioester hydrolase
MLTSASVSQAKGKALGDGESSGKHETRVRVRYAETDQMGVVYHANYLVWMEIGRVELVRSRGFNYKHLEQLEGLALAVIEVNCRYLSPARYDEEIIIQTEVTAATSRTIEFGYELRRAGPDGGVVATGSTRHMWVNREMRPTRLPEKYGDLLRLG